MGRASKVRRLPPELREQLHAMLDQGISLSDITEHLKGLGADVSRSGLGRYKQQVDKVAERMRESRQMAEVLMDRLGADAATGKGGAALVQMLNTLTSDYLLRRVDNMDEGEVEVGELRSLARTIKEAAQAARATQDYDQKLREDARREAEAKLREAAKTVADAPDAARLTPELMLERILQTYNGEG